MLGILKKKWKTNEVYLPLLPQNEDGKRAQADFLQYMQQRGYRHMPVQIIAAFGHGFVAARTHRKEASIKNLVMALKHAQQYMKQHGVLIERNYPEVISALQEAKNLGFE